MFEKYIDIETYDPITGLPNVSLIDPVHFIKTAEISGPIDNFISSLKPQSHLIYLLVNAMGAGEYYSSNRNGDFFPEDSLIKYHSTFVTGAKVYKHHQNKANDPSYGDVLFAYYNPHMHRIELVVTINRNLAPDLAERIDNGEYLAWSMGCKVPHDTCSRCRAKARTMAQYCEHLRRPNINRIDPSTGMKNYAINDYDLKFFDISVVRINADRTAYTLKKVASVEKQSTIIKKIPVRVEAVASTPKELLIRASQNNMSEDVIRTITKQADLGTVLRTMLAMRAMPTKRDFQTIVMYNSYKDDLAQWLNRQGYIFPNSDGPILMDIPKTYSQEVADTVLNRHPEMIQSKPMIISRIIHMTKKAEPEEELYNIPILTKIAGLYQWYIREFNSKPVEHGPLLKNAELVRLLYPKNVMFSKNAAEVTFVVNVSPSFLHPVDPEVMSGGIQLPTKRFTSFMIEKRGLSLENILNDIINQNSHIIDQIYENIY